MEKILFSILLANLFYSYIQAAAFPKETTESFIVHYLEDRRIVPVRIELNTELRTEHVLSSRGRETLYDFNQGKVAYKDTYSSQCFIADIIEESLERDRKRLRNLRNGIVKGFYLPTFIIQEEFINGTQILEKYGDRLAQFCEGNIVSSVATEHHRRKRDTSEDKGQFTHHSYGHYGHQSNNYAHYGHETHITGSVDKDGQIQNQRVSHQQVRSESSQGYPDQNFRNGPQVSTSDSRMGISYPQSQTQYQMPHYQQTFDGNGRNLGTGSSGQFSLQTAQESGYQLNLPLGLKAGNIYQGGIRSAGHYNVGGPQPQITAEFHKYPSSAHSATYRPGDRTSLSQISPSISSIPRVQYPSTTSIQAGLSPKDQTQIRYRTPLPGFRDLDQTKLTHIIPGTGVEAMPTLTQSGIYPPISPTGEGAIRPIQGTHTTDIQTDSRTFIPSSQRQPGVDISGEKKYVDQKISMDQNGIRHYIPSRLDHTELQTSSLHPGLGISAPGVQTSSLHPGLGISAPGVQTTSLHPGLGISAPGVQTTALHPRPGISAPGIQIPVFQPGISMPTMHIPESRAQSPWQTSTGIAVPGQTSTEITAPRTSVSRPGTHPDISIPSIHSPGSTIPSHLGSPGHISTGLEVTGIHPDLRHQQQYIPSGVPRQQFVQTPGTAYQSRYGTDSDIGTRSQVPDLYPPSRVPSHLISDKSGLIHTSQPVSSIPGAHSTVPGTSDQTTRNGIRYPDSPYPQSGIREEYPGAPGIPDDSRGTLITGVRPEDIQSLSRETGPILPGRTRDDRIVTDQLGQGSSRIYFQDSASSQTQIQTGIEGTAAEATAAGQYGGLGSQTQVQGGYAGNGSFSAQAQSGFTGGVAQSQVQGSKLGGLSGSSAQVERVGSAQSQVQVGQPSGAAASSAQGRFSGGTTQVQAQSGKSGGSAGAQAQSTGLSSSHVQVNIGGQDAREQEHFQGTVSASVHGGHSSGQSQTQLQGGYESGRTYVATAQGGFDSSMGLQVSVPPAGSLSNQTLRMRHPSSLISSQGPLHTADGKPSVDSPAFRMPTRSDFDEKQIYQTTKLSSRDQTTGPVSTVYTHPSETLPDQRHLQSGRLPQQQLPPTTISQPAFFPPPSHTQESRAQYPAIPSETQRPSHALPSPQSVRYPYPGYRTDVAGIPAGITDEKQMTSSQYPGYRMYDQHGVLPPGSQQIRSPGIPSHHVGAMQPSAHVPRTVQSKMQESPQYIPGFKPESSQDPSYPSSIVPTSQHTPHQQYNYIAGIPASYTSLSPHHPSASAFPQTPHSTTFESGYIPSYPPSSVLQRPGLPTDQLRFRSDLLPRQTEQLPSSSLFPGQSQIFPPSSQTIPSYRRPDEIPVLTRPDATHHLGHQLPPSTTQSQIRPIQPQISPTSSVSAPGISTPTATTGITQTGRPAVSEPDTSNCCEALRDLKRRCCDRSKKDEASSCCKSTKRDDIFDFMSEDDLDESKSDEPCKIVKAICYIVYKPVGKARVCKPTQTNGC